MYTSEISANVDKEYYSELIVPTKAQMIRKLMEKVQETLKFEFREVESFSPKTRRIIATVNWTPEE